MPVPDSCELQVIRALAKLGWVLVKRNYLLRLSDHPKSRAVYADLHLQEKSSKQNIIVEIKCFPKEDSIDSLYQVLGQYLIYYHALELKNQADWLYLALPYEIYTIFSQEFAIQASIKNAKMKLILVDIQKEKVLKWIH
jgi:hypothetical protein